MDFPAVQFSAHYVDACIRHGHHLEAAQELVQQENPKDMARQPSNYNNNDGRLTHVTWSGFQSVYPCVFQNAPAFFR